MLLLFAAIAAFAPFAYPIRGGALGDLDYGELFARLPLIHGKEDDKEFKRWDPYIDCVADFLDASRQRARFGTTVPGC